MDDVITRAKLSNGTRVLLINRPGAKTVMMRVAYLAGSRDEHDAIAGSAHYDEHMFFKGTPRRQTQHDVTRALERFGAELNADTDQEHTGFHAHVPADKFGITVDVLSDMLIHSLFRKEDIASERGAIIEEASSYLDNPNTVSAYMVHAMAFPDHPLGRPIIGTIDTIKELEWHGLTAFRRGHYVPENALITVAGNFHAGQAVELFEETFGKVEPRRRHGGHRRSRTAPEIRTDGPHVRLQRKRTAQQATLRLAFTAYPRESKNGAALTVLNMILAGGMSSRLFQILRSTHSLAYDVGAGSEPFCDAGLEHIVSPVRKDSAVKVVGLIVDELLRLKSDRVSMQELSDAISQAAGSAILDFEDVSAVAEHYSEDELLTANPRTIAEDLADIAAVTQQDVLRVAREVFRAKHAFLAVVAPAGKEAPLLQQLARLDD